MFVIYISRLFLAYKLVTALTKLACGGGTSMLVGLRCLTAIKGLIFNVKVFTHLQIQQ